MRAILFTAKDAACAVLTCGAAWNDLAAVLVYCFLLVAATYDIALLVERAPSKLTSVDDPSRGELLGMTARVRPSSPSSFSMLSVSDISRMPQQKVIFLYSSPPVRVCIVRDVSDPLQETCDFCDEPGCSCGATARIAVAGLIDGTRKKSARPLDGSPGR